jgi:hypothetical protein
MVRRGDVLHRKRRRRNTPAHDISPHPARLIPARHNRRG